MHAFPRQASSSQHSGPAALEVDIPESSNESSEMRPRRVRRKMTELEKIQYRQRRLLRACRACAASKRKCNHNQRARPGIDNSSDPTSSAVDPCFQRPLYARAKTDEPKSLIGTSGPSVEGTDEDHWSAEDSWLFQAPPGTRGGDNNHQMSRHLPSNYTSPSPYKPQSPETLAAILFTEDIKCEGVEDSWFGLGPQRIGFDHCYDLAISALQTACWFKRGLPGATLSKVYHAHGLALEALQMAMCGPNALYNDYTLASVAALSPVEAIRTGHPFLVPSHLDGLTGIIVSRASSTPLSELAHRILQYHFCDTFVMASVRGIASPLEKIDKKYCDPHEHSRTVPESRLRSMGNELCTRLPRLIALVRAASEHVDIATASSVLSLAEELYLLKDDTTAEDFLRSVDLTPTLLPTDAQISRYSLQHPTISSWEAGAYYWHSRIGVMRLCRRLRALFGAMCDIYSIPSIAELEVSLEKCLSNILMTAEFARTARARKRRRLFAQSLLACWSVVRDCPHICFGDRDVDVVQPWILHNFNMALLARPGTLTAQDMDDAANLFIGGPLRGTYRELYDARPPSPSRCGMDG